MRKYFFVVAGLLLLGVGCLQASPSEVQDEEVGLANPASVYCENQGGALSMRTDEKGTVGYCLFDDGTECEEWAFYRGECNQENMKESAPATQPSATQQSVAEQTPLTLSSSVFGNNGSIPAKYTCDGLEINPPFQILGVPEDTKSLALIVDDPDAPGGTWVHWVMWNIDPSTKIIAENSAPSGAQQGLTGSGFTSYEGPCPPSGTHRYYFKLYALDVSFDGLGLSTTSQSLMLAMQGHIVEQTVLMAKYGT